jgi:hypothetical protein
MMISAIAPTPDEILAALPKPSAETVTALPLRAGDTLVLCAGFEDRALAALGLALRDGREFHVIVINYAPFMGGNRHGRVMDLIASRRDVKVVTVCYDRENPNGFGAVLVDASKGARGRFYLDISGMSRLLIVQAVVALAARPGGLNFVSVIYTEAADYPPSRAEAEKVLAHSTSDPTFSALFLSSGVFEITIVPELSSVSPAPTQSRLVVFPCFDVHHLTALRAELQPSRITFIEGKPPRPEFQWRPAIIAALNHLQAIPEAERLQTSTLHYQETLDVLLELYRRHGLRERLLLAPTGSKMQTVAVGIFRAFVCDTQIVYSTPRGFVSPDNYTHGVGTTCQVCLDGFAKME